MQLLTINDAAALVGKSIQTIRRMIKHKKIQVKRQKTPQGFNYLIIKESLTGFLNQPTQPSIQQDVSTQTDTREHRPIEERLEHLFRTEVERFNTTMQQLIDQHSNDKKNFFQLIKTFQDRVIELENQVKLLESPKTNWWQFWK